MCTKETRGKQGSVPTKCLTPLPLQSKGISQLVGLPRNENKADNSVAMPYT